LVRLLRQSPPCPIVNMRSPRGLSRGSATVGANQRD
jgi:hypothetical protein